MVEPSPSSAIELSDALPAAGPAPSPSTTSLTGPQKAAIVLLKLGRERSAEIMKLLGDREVSELSAEIARAKTVDSSDVQASINEFAQLASVGGSTASGGIETAREMLEAAVGPDRAAIIWAELQLTTARQPFEFITKTDPRQVVNVLSGEHPQTVALVLANISPDHASAILGGLGEDMQREVSLRVAKLEQTTPDVINQLDEILHRRFGSGTTRRSALERADGVQTLVEILNRSDRATERAIFEGLEESEKELAEHVRRKMFVFEDIVDLDDRAIQLVLRNVDSANLATALKGVRPDVKAKVTNNMSERAAANLEDEIKMLGQVRLATVEEAQGEVVQQIRALEESGEIVVSRGAEEFVQ